MPGEKDVKSRSGLTRRALPLGLGAAALLRATARAAPLKTPLTHPLPAGVLVDRSNPAQPTIYIKQAVTLDGWDLRGHVIFVDDSITGAISNSLLSPPQGRVNVFGQGQNDPAHNPHFAITDSEIDLGSNTIGYFNGLMIFSGSFDLLRNRLRNAPVTFVNFHSNTPGARFLCEDNTFGSPGVNAISDAAHPENNSHCEAIVVQAGSAIIRRNRFDPGDGVGRTKPRTMTGQMLIQGQFGDVDALIEGNHVLGSGRMLAPYAIQAGGGPHKTSLRLVDNTMEPGSAGPDAYVLVSGTVAMTASGNRDSRGASIL